MVLDEFRSDAEPYLEKVARRFTDTDPDTLSWLAFAMAISAFLSFVSTRFVPNGHFMLIFGSLFVALNAFLDMLDGKVARLRGIESPRGDFLDHILDRYADLFIIGGITLTPWCDIRIGILAMLGVFLASYMGTQAQAMGLKRDYSGMLGRADRLALLIGTPIVQLVLIEFGYGIFFTIESLPGGAMSFSLIGFLLCWFAIAGHVTAIQRAVRSWQALSVGNKPSPPPKKQRKDKVDVSGIAGARGQGGQGKGAIMKGGKKKGTRAASK